VEKGIRKKVKEGSTKDKKEVERTRKTAVKRKIK